MGFHGRADYGVGGREANQPMHAVYISSSPDADVLPRGSAGHVAPPSHEGDEEGHQLLRGKEGGGGGCPRHGWRWQLRDATAAAAKAATCRHMKRLGVPHPHVLILQRLPLPHGILRVVLLVGVVGVWRVEMPCMVVCRHQGDGAVPCVWLRRHAHPRHVLLERFIPSIVGRKLEEAIVPKDKGGPVDSKVADAVMASVDRDMARDGNDLHGVVGWTGGGERGNEGEGEKQVY